MLPSTTRVVDVACGRLPPKGCFANPPAAHRNDIRGEIGKQKNNGTLIPLHEIETTK
jgi:hypothetical protein